MDGRLISGTDRQQQILQLVEQHRRIRIEQVCSSFAVSPATARRDLDTLAHSGRLQRVHGGAIALNHPPSEPPNLQRQAEQKDEKLRIARAAAALVQDGDTILLGSGTTVLAMASFLRQRSRLTVFTNSLPVINALAGLEQVEVICLGGMLRDSELSFIGHLTEQALSEIHADKVFLGIRAISLEQGLSNEYLPETMTDRALLKAGREIIVLADHTKFGRAATVLVAPLERVHTIVTDDAVPTEYITAIQEKGLHLLIAPSG